MTWPDAFKFATAVIASIGGGGALVMAFSGWLGKVWAARILERERATYAAELEERKAELTRLGTESQIRYSRLHERRATIISNIYARLEDLHATVKDLASLSPAKPMEELEAARRRTAKAYQRLATYFYRRGIWLDPATCEAIHNILDLISRTTSGLQYHLFGWDLPAEKLDQLESRLNVDIPAARALLDARFRAILSSGGVGDVPEGEGRCER